MSQSGEVLAIGDPRLDEKARSLFILIGVFFPLSTIALILRLYTRVKQRSILTVDDYFAILSWTIWVVWVSLATWAGKNGGGWPSTSLPLQYNEINLKTLYIGPIMSASLMTAAKFSILTLYLRLFQPSRSFRIQSRIVAVLCFLWWMAACFATIFQCKPIRAGWSFLERIQPSTKCADYKAFFVGIEVPNAFLDYVLAAMAIQVVRGLQIKLLHKVGLIAMFLLCTVVAFLGLFRVSLTYHPEHYAVWLQYEWLAVQNPCFVICCCIPTYGIYLTKLSNAFNGVTRYVRSLSDRMSVTRGEKQSQSSRSSSEATVQQVGLDPLPKQDRHQISIVSEVDISEVYRSSKDSLPEKFNV